MNKKLIALVSTSFLSLAAQASVSISLDLGTLYGSSISTIFPDGGLIQLVASTQDSDFAAPAVGAFVNGDDVILASFGLDSSLTGIPGTTSVVISDINYVGALGAGDALMLRWFPTLTAGSTTSSLTAGTIFGQFTSSSPVDVSAAWFLPSDGAALGLQFLTTSTGVGSWADSQYALATNTVVPEPSTYAAVLGSLVLGVVGYRRFRKR